MTLNPIVRKELLLTARQKSTYWVRAGLPALAGALLLVQVWVELRHAGPDWREVAELSWRLFATTAWLQLVALSGLAFVIAQNSISEEWTGETMEVLCTTPVSGAGLLLGKFVSVLGKVLMAALTLLPFSAVLFHVGHVPYEVGLGSVGVIVGSVLVCGALGFVVATRSPEGRARRRRRVPVLVLLYLAFLAWRFWLRRAPLPGVVVAAVPPLALARVLWVTGAGRLGPGWLSLVSLLLMCAASGLTLGWALRRFQRTFEKRLTMGRKPRMPADLLKDVGVGRRPMKLADNPLIWQETLPRANVPWFSAVACILSFTWVSGAWIFLSTQRQGKFSLSVFPAVALVAALAPAIYGAGIFAREKAGRTAQALLLTGGPPKRFLWAKVLAVYWLLSWPLVIMAVSCLLMGAGFVYLQVFSQKEVTLWLILLGELLLVGPGVAALVGMVFGIVADSPARALVALLASIFCCLLLVEVVLLLARVSQAWLASAVAALLGVWLVALGVRKPETWTSWHSTALFSLCLWAFWAYVSLLRRAMGVEGAWLAFLVLLGANLLTASVALVWWKLAAGVFEPGLTRERAGGRDR